MATAKQNAALNRMIRSGRTTYLSIEKLNDLIEDINEELAVIDSNARLQIKNASPSPGCTHGWYYLYEYRIVGEELKSPVYVGSGLPNEIRSDAIRFFGRECRINRK